MKIQFRQFKYSWFAAFCFLGVAAIIACNVYLLCCGRCVVNDFLRIPPIGWFIIAANLIAGMILFSIKKRKKNRQPDDVCTSCYVSLRDDWVYCPNCGQDVAR